MSENEKNNLIDSMVPSWTDSDKSKAESFRKGVQHFKGLEATPLLDTYGLKKKFPEFKYTSPKAGK
jgi:hypothetical protein